MISQEETGATHIDPAHPLKVGRLELRNRVFLAPMSGITDAPFRRLAWRFGAGLVVSEMVASEALVEGNAEMTLKAASAGLPLHAVQIAGREAKWMRLAARMAEGSGADLIDINMGCPARRVTTGYSGSALMRDLDHALTLVDAVVDEVSVPVTLKMRLGWDDNSMNAPELAARAEAAGIAMITVHGRTRCQFYDGKADWAAVAAVRQATSLPLVVNGDIADEVSMAEALRLSGADAAMVGRASQGAPWLAGELAVSGRRPEGAELAETVAMHYEEVLAHYGVVPGIRHARKHLAWYLDAADVDGGLRREILTGTEPGRVLALVGSAFSSAATGRKAA